MAVPDDQPFSSTAIFYQPFLVMNLLLSPALRQKEATGGGDGEEEVVAGHSASVEGGKALVSHLCSLGQDGLGGGRRRQ